MAAVGEDDIVAYVITGEEERDRFGHYIVPQNATHVSVHESVKIIPVSAFYQHPNIVELFCHDGVEEIKGGAFFSCPRLRRVIMRGVKVLCREVFQNCEALEEVEWDNLETIEKGAFKGCKSLRSINLPSARMIGEEAFWKCCGIKDATFGSELHSINWSAFHNCLSLERITIPLKDGVIRHSERQGGLGEGFIGCEQLKRVDIVEEAILRETIAGLQLQSWRNDLNGEIDSINQILPELSSLITIKRYANNTISLRAPLNGGKAPAIREWIRRVLHKMSDYEAQHRHFLSEAAVTLQLALPKDIVMNHVVPFLNLPLHTMYGRGE